MQGRRERQTRADPRRRKGRPADAEPREGEDVIRQPQQIARFRRMVADGADRAGAEAHRLRRRHEGAQGDRRIRAGVDHRVQMIIGERDAVNLMQAALAAMIAAEHQHGRRAGYPVLIGDQRVEPRPQRRVPNDDDVPLLQVAFRRGRKGDRRQSLDQHGVHRAIGIAAGRAARRHARHGLRGVQRLRDLRRVPETGRQQIGQSGHCFSPRQTARAVVFRGDAPRA